MAIVAIAGVCIITLVMTVTSVFLFKPVLPTQPPPASPTALPGEVIFQSPTALPTNTAIASTPEAVVSLTPTQTEPSAVDGYLATMSIEQKTGQMILMDVTGEELTAGDCQTVQQVMPGGIVFHGANVSDPEQLRRLISELKNCAAVTTGIPLIFAIDHEGQFVNRFESGMTVFPSAQALGATNNPSYAYQTALASGQELSSTGISMVLGPVADVLTNYDNTVIGERSFGSDPQKVGQFVAQAVQGYRQAGLIPVLKHFPGHGGTNIDSHDTLPIDNASPQALSETYFPPFIQGINAGAPVVMMGHIALSQIDPTNMPASLSAPIINTLRNQLGFQGIVITDSLDMGALNNTGLDFPAVALTSVKAGTDMLITLSPPEALIARDRLRQAVEQGELSAEQVDRSVRNILHLKEQHGLLSTYPAGAQPNWQSDQAVAYDAGYHSVGVLKNAAGLVPIPPDVRNILIIAPPNVAGLDSVLNNALQMKGFTTQIAYYPDPQRGVAGNDAMINDLVYQAANNDLTLVLTWQAHSNRIRYGDDWQARLVAALQQVTPRLVVGALKSSTDRLEFPTVSTFISTFGTTGGQLQALADILVGNQNALGMDPLSQLP